MDSKERTDQSRQQLHVPPPLVPHGNLQKPEKACTTARNKIGEEFSKNISEARGARGLTELEINMESCLTLRLLLGSQHSESLPKIPKTFSDAEEYRLAFRPHLLSETICALQSASREAKPLFDARVFQKDNVCTMEPIGMHKIRPKDVLVFAKSQRLVQNIEHFIAIVQRPASDQNNLFTIRVCGKNDETVIDLASNWSVFAIGSLLTAARISKAMQSDAPIVAAILSPRSNIHAQIKYLNSDSVALQMAKDLNQSQQEAMIEVMSLDSCKGVSIIQGPPGLHYLNKGTGKTRTLSAIVIGLLENGNKILYSAPTNHAAKEGARQMLSILQKNPDLSFVSLSDILLVGNKDGLNLELDPGCKSLWLNFRIEEIKRITKGWIAAYIEFENVLVYPSRIKALVVSEDIWADFSKYFLECFDIFRKMTESLRLVFENMIPSVFSGEFRLSISHLTDAESFTKHFDSIYQKPYSSNGDDFKAMLFGKSMARLQIDDLFLRQMSKVKSNLSGNFKLLVFCRKFICQDLERILIFNSYVVFSTVSQAGRKILAPFLEQGPVVLIDEAAQLVEAESLIILQHTSCKYLVLAGDDKQLPATVFSKECLKAGYSVSIFERLISLGVPSTLLNQQYRMHSHISSWPSLRFYDGNVVDSYEVLNRQDRAWHQNPMFAPLKLFNLSVGEEKRCLDTSSTYNNTEVSFISELLKQLGKKFDFQEPITVGIITFYRAQKDRIIKKLVPKHASGNISGRIQISKHLFVTVDTVDAFQGQERDIIILSTVRSNCDSNIGFAKDPRRLNVALTRAKYSLWVIVNTKTFSEDQCWSSLINHCEKQNFVQSAGEDKQIQSAMRANIAVTDLMAVSNTVIKIRASIWDIEISKQAKSAIENLGEGIISIFVGKIQAIAEGPKVLKGSVSENENRLRKFKLYNDLYVIWSIEIESLLQEYQQVIHVWDICDAGSVAQIYKKISHILVSRTREYADASMQRTYITDQDRRVCHPTKFPKPAYKIEFYQSRQPAKIEYVNSAIDSDLTNLVKTYHLSQEVIKLMQTDVFKQLELPFKMGDDEQALVDYNASLFILGRSGTGKTTVMLTRMLAREKIVFDVGIQGSKQLLVTCNDRLRSASEVYYRKIRLSVPVLQDVTPPIFLSFQGLLEKLETKLKVPFFNRNDRNSVWMDQYDETNDMAVMNGRYLLNNEVKFKEFSTRYYPRFQAIVKKKFNPAILWMEIQGSIQVLACDQGHLSCNEYLEISNSRVSILNEHDRTMIYASWQEYERLKRKALEWDLSDLVTYIYQQLKKKNDIAAVDYVYVDEVQDLTQVQIALFRFICKNNEGFVFGGDTAQTIASGVGFRFQDVQDLFYSYYLESSKDQMPSVWCLTQNYRTHSGILRLSGSVLDLMFQMFPLAVDKVASEKGAIFNGNLPVFIIKKYEDSIIKIMSADAKINCIEMGAEQCIIVRNNETKKKLRDELPSALILTVFESKGMEFEDVLVYNFFSDSLFSRWRLVLQEQNAENYHGFDARRDYALCTELKGFVSTKIELYVAITRAKFRLFIIDDSNILNPMIDLWKSMSHIVFATNAHFAKASTPESWNQRGLEFSDLGQFGDARFCFIKADNPTEIARCQAYLDLDIAEVNFSEGKVAASKVYFIKAAVGFVEVGLLESAAKAYLKGKKERLAADLYIKIDQIFTALGICLHFKLPEIALGYFNAHRLKKVVDTEMEKFARFFALASMRAGNLTDMMKFLSHVKKSGIRSFLIRYKQFENLYKFDKSNGDWKSAAESAELRYLYKDAFTCYSNNGNHFKALDIYLKFFLRPRLILNSFKSYYSLTKSQKCYRDKDYEKHFVDLGQKVNKMEIKTVDGVSKILDFASAATAEINLLEYCASTIKLAASDTYMSNFDSAREKLAEDSFLRLLALKAIFVNNINRLSRLKPFDDLLKHKEKLKDMIEKVKEISQLISTCSLQTSGLAGFSSHMEGLSSLFPVELVGTNVCRMPPFLAEELGFGNAEEVAWSFFQGKLIKGLNQMKMEIILLMNQRISDFILLSEHCSSIFLSGNVSCQCPKNHDAVVARKVGNIHIELNFEMTQLLQDFKGNVETDRQKAAGAKFLVRALFPESFYLVDIRYLAKQMINPAILFAIEMYSSTTVFQAGSKSVNGSAQSLLLRFISKAKVSNEKILHADNILHGLQQSIRWNESSCDNEKISLGHFIRCGCQFLIKCFETVHLDLKAGTLSDCFDIYFSALIFHLSMMDRNSYFPPSLLMKLTMCNSKSLKSWTATTQDYKKQMETVLRALTGKLLEIFQVSHFKFYKEYFEKSHKYFLRYLRLIFMVYLNFQFACYNDILKDIDEKLFDSFHEIATRCNMVSNNLSALNEHLKNSKSVNSRVQTCHLIIEWFKVMNEPILGLSSGLKRSNSKEEPLAPIKIIFTESKLLDFELFYEEKLPVARKPLRIVLNTTKNSNSTPKSAKSSEALDVDLETKENRLPYKYVTRKDPVCIDKSALSTQSTKTGVTTDTEKPEEEPVLLDMITHGMMLRLENVVKRIRKRCALKKELSRTDLSIEERLKFVCASVFENNDALNNIYSKNLMNHAIRISKEKLEVRKVIKHIENRVSGNLCLERIGLGGTEEEMIEILYNREEFLESELIRISPYSCLKFVSLQETELDACFNDIISKKIGEVDIEVKNICSHVKGKFKSAHGSKFIL